MLCTVLMAIAVGGAGGTAAVVGGAGGATAVAPPSVAVELSTVVEIDKRCDAAEKASGRRADRSFGEASGKWREFRDPVELRRATKTTALVWSSPNGVQYGQLSFGSETGDWAQVADLCFRPDGTLARVTDTIDNFADGGGSDESDDVAPRSSRGVRTTHYAPDGRRLRRTSRVFGQESGKTAKSQRVELSVDNTYLRVADLPFAELLRKPKEVKQSTPAPLPIAAPR